MAKLEDGSYDNDAKFAEYQNKWQETKDKKWLWQMYPLYLHAIKSVMVKRLKGKIIPFFNEKAESAAIYAVEYHIKHQDKIIRRLMGWASVLGMYALYTKKKGENWDDWELLEDEEDQYGSAENRTADYE